jgi:hypothetical protein
MGGVIFATHVGTKALADGDKVPTLAELTGEYVYAGDRAKDESAVKAQSDAATADMSRMVLKRALPRLQSSTRIPERLTIKQQDGKVMFKMDDHMITVPENGSAVAVTTPLDESANASFDVKTATLLQSVPSTGGQKRNVFRLDETGALEMQVRVTNSRLAAPVVFTVRYAPARN